MSIAELGLALLSGVLSTLSPCVLPLLPIILVSAVQAHRFGAVALGVGLTLSFTAFGLFIATVGLSLGLDAGVFRVIAGVLLLIFGAVMVIPWLQARFMRLTSAIASRGGTLSSQVDGSSLHGQFIVGVVLGMVWTPCVGPTIGAAATLASSGHDLGHAAAIMLTFGVGAALPLVLVGSLSRARLLRLRGRMQSVASGGKQLLGVLFVLIGLGILTGYDRHLEAWLVTISPDWLTQLTTRF